MKQLAGVDGCRHRWLYVFEAEGDVTAGVASTLRDLLAELPDDVLLAVDVPIGLTDAGFRECDRAARRLLGRPRGSSVFPAPVRAALAADDYAAACELHVRADGRKLSRQAFGILPKIREIDALLRGGRDLVERVVEVHPEVSFAYWNLGTPMRHRKGSSAGRAEREALIDATWPGVVPDSWRQLAGERCQRDDLNDALAALWTARRIASGTAVTLPSEVPRDTEGIPMQMLA